MSNVCNVCKKEKGIDSFTKDKSKKFGRTNTCRECSNARTRKWSADHPQEIKDYRKKYRIDNIEKIRSYHHKNKAVRNKQLRERWKNDSKFREKNINWRLRGVYGITLKEYNDLLEKQKGICLICKRLQNSRNSSRLFVDHDHRTNKVRGLLCHKCNSGLGSFDDNTVFLQEAINYLKSQ